MSKRPRIAQLVRRSARRPTNVAALAAASVAAAASAHLWLWAVAFVLYVLVIARDASSPRFWRAVNAADEAVRRQLPSADELADETLRAIVAGLHAGFAEIARLERTDAYAGPASVGLDELRARAAELARACDAIHRHLQAARGDDVAREAVRLRQLVVTAKGDARREYERAVEVRGRHLAVLEQIHADRDAMMAALHLILAHVEAVPSRVFRLAQLDPPAVEELLRDVSDDVPLLEAAVADDGTAGDALRA